MNEESFHGILLDYTSTDRESLMEPIPCKEWRGMEWVCATDAHALILIPKSLCKDYPAQKYHPDPIGVLPEVGIGIPISGESLKIALAKCKTIDYPETVCTDCDGRGRFDHGRHTYDCQECDGSGIENPAETCLDKDARFLIKDCMIKPDEFLRAEKSFRKIGGIVEVVYHAPTRIMFRCGDAYILIMGCVQPPTPEHGDKCTIIEV